MGHLFRNLFRRAKPLPVAKPVNIPTAAKVTGPVFGPVAIAKPVHIPTPRKVGKPRFVLGRGSPPTGMRENPLYAVPTAYLTEFLGGEEIGLTSSWLAAARYAAEEQALYVTFLDRHPVRVTPITSTEAVEFFQSASKGGWYWSFVLGPGYVMGDRSTGRKHVEDV